MEPTVPQVARPDEGGTGVEPMNEETQVKPTVPKVARPDEGETEIDQ